jgi:3-oxosteroid 1-dehydrogenase
MTVDLLVVGSGTGIAAALTAHESGLTALIVEKSRYVGGSTARSGGALWLPTSPILEEKAAGDSLERATTYLRSVVADSAPAARSDAFLHNVTATVEMLRRTTPIRLTWAKDYSDYHPELPGGAASGRTCECRPLNTAILGEHRARLRPGVMEVKIPMPTTFHGKACRPLPNGSLRGWVDLHSADAMSRADRPWPQGCSPVR